MSRWFRVDDGLVDDPKVQQLPDRLFRAVINLWCITSQGGGNLPPIEQIAFKLRVSATHARTLLAELQARGLIDEDERGTRPHNWNGRQFRSDTSTERVKRFRQRQRNVSETANETKPETPPDTETDTDDDADDAHARGNGGLISQTAMDLTAQIAAIVGYPTPDDWPPGWCGAPYRVQIMLDGGWRREIILASTREVMGRRGGTDPPSSIKYFEKAFAQAHAEHAQPLPTVTVKPGEVIHETHRAPRRHRSAITEALERQLERYQRASEGEGGEAGDSDEIRDGPVGLLPHGRGE
jgi:hypothetical protein